MPFIQKTLSTAVLMAISGTAVAAGTDELAVGRALNLLQAKGAASAARVSANDRFEARHVIRDADGTEHVRFNRTYAGLPVIGGDMVVHSRNGQLKSTSLTLGAPLALSTRPSRKASDAIVDAGVQFGSNFVGVPTTALVVYARDAGAAKLAWQVNFVGTDKAGAPVDATYFVDARSGQVLDHWSNIHSATAPGTSCTPTANTPASGTGKSLYAGNVTLTTTNCGASFELKDPSRGGNATRNMKGSWESLVSGVPFNDLDNSFGNNTMADTATVAADIHYGIANTWDYFKNVHGRLGVANNGKGILARAHYGQNYYNAFWQDRCQCIAFGDGGGTWYGNPVGPMASLDMTGHEMSHGVTAHTAGLIYSKESGGLNEATSDIFGTMAEFYANNPSDTPDYLIAETNFIPNPGNTLALRYMFHPSKDKLSSDCYTSNVGNWGVHYSSGIANHFFYLLAEGSGAKTFSGVNHASPTCNKASLAGIGRGKAEKIWYRALAVYMTSNTNYAGARKATVSAANDLYGVNSTESKAVIAAWNAVLVR